jgi:predicted transporter
MTAIVFLMEWMLQVVDEVEDAVNQARFRVVDFGAEIGLAGCGAIAAVTLAAAAACGAEALVLSCALGVLAAAVLMKAQHRLQLAPAADT